MKRAIFIIFLVFSLSIPFNAYAKVYFTLAPTISLENFELKGEHETLRKKESYGLNIKIGYNFDNYDYISLELDYDYVAGFEGYFMTKINGIDYIIAGEVQIDTLIPMFKASVGTDKYKNYFSIGLGYMSADFGFSKSDICWKFGIGLDYIFAENLCLTGNINYIIGSADVTFVEYYNGSLGFTFFF